LSVLAALQGGASGTWTRSRGIERICCTLGTVLIASGLSHLAVFAVDGGPWNGPVSWRKPTTFGLSFGLTLITVTWVASYLRISERLRAVLLGVFAADCFVEVGGITLQAWRRVPSHVNTETPLDSAVSMTLAAGGGVLIVILGALAVISFRPNPGIGPGMRVALRAGFATLMIGLATGAGMIARGVTLVNSGQRQEAYQALGFLKPVHAVSLHGVLVLPALAYLLSFTAWDEARRTRVVALAVTGYALAIAAALAYSLLR